MCLAFRECRIKLEFSTRILQMPQTILVGSKLRKMPNHGGETWSDHQNVCFLLKLYCEFYVVKDISTYLDELNSIQVVLYSDSNSQMLFFFISSASCSIILHTRIFPFHPIHLPTYSLRRNLRLRRHCFGYCIVHTSRYSMNQERQAEAQSKGQFLHNTHFLLMVKSENRVKICWIQPSFYTYFTFLSWVKIW